MATSKQAVILVTVVFVGMAAVGQGQQVPSSQAGRRGSSGGQPGTDAEAVNLIGQKSELSRRAQVLEMDLAGIDARCKALQERVAALRGGAGKQSADGGQLEEFTKELSRLAVDKAGKEAQLQTVREQLGETQKELTQVAPLPPRTDAEAVNLIGQKSELARRAQVLQMDLAGIDARYKALQEQIAMLRGDEGQLEEFAKDLSRLAVDKAGKEAQLQVVREQLGETQKELTQVTPLPPRTDAEAVNLIGQQSELARRAQVLQMDLAGIEARRKALQEQIAVIRNAASEGAAGSGQLQEFTRELRRLAVEKAGQEAQLQTVREQLGEVQKQFAHVAPVALHTDAEAVNLGGQKSELTRRAQVLQMDLAGIEARRKALQEQIAMVRGDAAKRSAGSGQLEEFTKELGCLAVDKAGKEAQLQTVRRQLNEVQKQLSQALMSNR